MLNACATALTDRLLYRFPMAQARRAVYIYGFELTLSSFAVMTSVFILSCLCGAVYTSITFSLIFVSIRFFLAATMRKHMDAVSSSVTQCTWLAFA